MLNAKVVLFFLFGQWLSKVPWLLGSRNSVGLYFMWTVMQTNNLDSCNCSLKLWLSIHLLLLHSCLVEVKGGCVLLGGKWQLIVLAPKICGWEVNDMVRCSQKKTIENYLFTLFNKIFCLSFLIYWVTWIN